jgi:hypothetical protein
MPNTYCFSSYVLSSWEVQIKNQGMFLALVNCFWILIYLSKCWGHCQEKWKWIGEGLAEFSQTNTSLWCTGLSGGAPDSVRCPGWPTDELVALGKSEGAAAKNHRTVRCAPDCPVSQQRPRPTVVSAISGQRVARANGRLVTPDCPVRQREPRSYGRLRW